jgi:lipopolysaccharide transport system permease protein
MTLSQHLQFAMPRALFRHRDLLLQLVKREVEARYRGSVLGLLWSFAIPLLMLAVFTFVFSAVFQMRWGKETGDRAEFALMLFPGMVLHGLFAEVLGRAPGLIVSNPNYVKKIIFPLEILPAVAVGSALFQAVVGLLAVVAFQLFLRGSIPLTILWTPVVLAPFVVLLLGVAWLLSSLGVYLRDLAQLSGVVATILMFMSPVFYPIDALPVAWRGWVYASPLTLILEQTRGAMLLGRAPDPASLAAYAFACTLFAGLALYWFNRTRKGFADVL